MVFSKNKDKIECLELTNIQQTAEIERLEEELENLRTQQAQVNPNT